VTQFCIEEAVLLTLDLQQQAQIDEQMAEEEKAGRKPGEITTP